MKSIAKKLWLGMMILVVLMLVLLWVFQIVLLKPFYQTQQVSKLKDEGKRIARQWGVMDESAFQDWAERLFYEYKVGVEVYDPKGYSLFSSQMVLGNGRGQSPMMWRAFVMEKMLQEVLLGKITTEQVVHPRILTEYILVGIPVNSGAGIQGGLFMTMPLASVDQVADTLKNQLLIVTGILLGATLVLAFVMSRIFTRPVRDITLAAEQMALGNLVIHLEPKSGDEIGRLASTMNDLAKQLSKTEQLRRELIANVSHELRTPLSLIRGYAETIQDVTGNNAQKRDQQLQIIIEEAERLGIIVADILNLSQLQAGYFKLDSTSFNLRDTVFEAVSRYDLHSRQSGIALEVRNHKKGNFEKAPLLDESKQEEEANPLVLGDEKRIGQVLYNLITNAFNHTPKGGKIEICMMDQGHSICIEVSDTGKGIAPQDIEHIWDRYYKANETTRDTRVGSGLGLAIVKSILEAHQAMYGVKSDVGKGTTFWFTLPKKKWCRKLLDNVDS